MTFFLLAFGTIALTVLGTLSFAVFLFMLVCLAVIVIGPPDPQKDKENAQAAAILAVVFFILGSALIALALTITPFP